MAGAFAAKADDASAIIFNPAGIASLSGLQAYAGLGIVFAQPSGTAANGPRESADVLIAPLPQLYVSYGLPHDVAIGIGMFSNFGLKIEWPQNWTGRFLDTYINLTTITINPTIAWRPIRWLSIGAGFDISPAYVDIKRQVNLISTEGALRFRGNDVGLSGNFGVLFEGPVLEHRQLALFSLGVTYRSRYHLDFDDGAITVTAPPELSARLHDSKATARVPIPDIVTVGVGLRPIDDLFLQVQFDWTHWSTFQSLQLMPAGNPALAETIPENWNDGYTVRAGGEYRMSRVRIRAGVGYDWTPIPASTLSPIIPDANRILASVGIGVDLPAHLTLEASILGIITRTRTSELPALPIEYSSFGLLPAVSLSYRSPQHPPQRCPPPSP
jgi:long-chain fatty acid transport protein